MSAATIIQRLDVAIERARWRYPESPPKRFYLDVADWHEFDEAMRVEWPSAAHTFSYLDIQIYPAKRSRLCTKHGCIVCVPKHVRSLKAAA